MTQRKAAAPATGTATHHDRYADRRDPTASLRQVHSRQVSWFETYAFASRIAAQHGYSLTAAQLPAPGTPAWCGMNDTDARKLLALLLRGVQAALDDDVHQADIAAASRAVARSPRSHFPRTRQRGAAYIPRQAVP